MSEAEDWGVLPGGVGPFIDEVPILNHAHIRPYIIAILIHRGAVTFTEILHNLTPHCPQIDLKIGAYGEFEDVDPDKSRLEILTEEVLGEMVAEQLLIYNDIEDRWVLSRGQNSRNLPTIISWVATLGGQMPHHLLIDHYQ